MLRATTKYFLLKKKDELGWRVVDIIDMLVLESLMLIYLLIWFLITGVTDVQKLVVLFYSTTVL